MWVFERKCRTPNHSIKTFCWVINLSLLTHNQWIIKCVSLFQIPISSFSFLLHAAPTLMLKQHWLNSLSHVEARARSSQSKNVLTGKRRRRRRRRRGLVKLDDPLRFSLWNGFVGVSVASWCQCRKGGKWCLFDNFSFKQWKWNLQ